MTNPTRLYSDEANHGRRYSVFVFANYQGPLNYGFDTAADAVAFAQAAWARQNVYRVEINDAKMGAIVPFK